MDDKMDTENGKIITDVISSGGKFAVSQNVDVNAITNINAQFVDTSQCTEFFAVAQLEDKNRDIKTLTDQNIQMS